MKSQKFDIYILDMLFDILLIIGKDNVGIRAINVAQLDDYGEFVEGNVIRLLEKSSLLAY
jgi:hypothetical protein